MDEEAAIAELLRLGWSRETLAVWRRAGHKCEYCGTGLLGCVDDYLYGSHVDHIVPGAGNDPENLALACKMCNFVKRNGNFTDPDRSLTRAEIISRVKAFVMGRRELSEKRLEQIRVLLMFLAPEV